MTTREQAYTHLQNARALYQHLTNQTGDQVAWRAAQVLSLLERAVDEGEREDAGGDPGYRGALQSPDEGQA